MTESASSLSQAIEPNATIVPVFRCASLEHALRHYRALGFHVTFEQSTPYSYAATQWGPFELHFHGIRKMSAEHAASCLVMVNNVSRLYRAMAQSLRATYRGLPVSGAPRITRLRTGNTRFTVYDGDGNQLQFIARDEPDYDYDTNAHDDRGFGRTLSGIARTQSPLLRALEAAVFLRDTYHDDRAAARKLDNALRRAEPSAVVDYARVLAARAELAVALGEEEILRDLRKELALLKLSDEDMRRYRAEFEAADLLEQAVRSGDDSGAVF